MLPRGEKKETVFFFFNRRQYESKVGNLYLIFPGQVQDFSTNHLSSIKVPIPGVPLSIENTSHLYLLFNREKITGLSLFLYSSSTR